MLGILPWSIIAAFLFIWLFVYLPGRLVVSLTKLPKWFDLQLAIGLAILPLILFFGRFLIPLTWLLGAYLLVIIFLSRKLSFKPQRLVLDKRILFALLIGILAQSLPYLKTLNLDQITLAIASNHDQAWHMSLIHELTSHFPPSIPGFSGSVLKNYHYFYDLIIAANATLFKAKIEVLIQLAYPLFFSFLFGLSVWRVLALITKNKTYQSLGILLAFFANNLSFTTSNFFLIDQPLFFLFNQQTVLSIALVLYLLIILNQQLHKPSTRLGVLIGIILASLSFLKVYAFLCLGLILLILSVRHFKKLLLSFISAGLLGSLILVLTFEPTKPMLILKPLWFTAAFTDRIIAPFMPQLYARSHHFLYQPLIIFLILFLNYHLRLFGLLIKKRSLLINLITLTVISSLVLIFSVFQTQSPYNIIQFAPYATVGLGILLVAYANNLKPKLGLALLFATLILSLPASFKTLTAFARSKPTLSPLKHELVEVIKHLESQPPGLTLSLVDRDYHVIPDPHRPLNFIGNNLISSIGKKQTFFADQKQLEVLNLNYQPRLNQINHLKQTFCQTKTLLIKEKIKYILIADDLLHCAGDDQILFTSIYQSKHFGLFKLDY